MFLYLWAFKISYTAELGMIFFTLDVTGILPILKECNFYEFQLKKLTTKYTSAKFKNMIHLSHTRLRHHHIILFLSW